MASTDLVVYVFELEEGPTMLVDVGGPDDWQDIDINFDCDVDPVYRKIAALKLEIDDLSD